MMTPPHTASRLVIGTLLLCLGGASAGEAALWPAARTDVYASLASHVRRQIDKDKAAFTQASTCTTWFYEQEKRAPAPPVAQPIQFQSMTQSLSREDCQRLYPGGLDAVREDFHRTQTTLSFSLTFYEFTLVGDRNDDHRYNREELRDLLLALTLPAETRQAPDQIIGALTAQFDAWHRTRDLERLMTGMSQLYEKGYRVSPSDRAELDQASR